MAKREWLIKARRDKGLRQYQISDLLGISRVFYTQIEQGSRGLSFENAKHISKILKIPWMKFLKLE